MAPIPRKVFLFVQEKGGLRLSPGGGKEGGLFSADATE